MDGEGAPEESRARWQMGDVMQVGLGWAGFALWGL